MTDKLEILKKRLIYRASYRGTKEMDILLSTFVNKYIDSFDEPLLSELETFLNFEDETKKLCSDIVAKLGASSIKDMGKVMGELKKNHSDSIDFSKAGSILKEILNK